MALRCRAIAAAPRPIDQVDTLESQGNVYRMSRRGVLTAEERDEAAIIVERVLLHTILRQARDAEKKGRPCRREAPVSIVIDDVLVDGQVDLAFEGDEGWTVVDFKTDVEIAGADDSYRRQVALYTHAIAKISGRPARGLLLRV